MNSQHVRQLLLLSGSLVLAVLALQPFAFTQVKITTPGTAFSATTNNAAVDNVPGGRRFRAESGVKLTLRGVVRVPPSNTPKIEKLQRLVIRFRARPGLSLVSVAVCTGTNCPFRVNTRTEGDFSAREVTDPPHITGESHANVWNFNPPIAVGQQSTVVLQVQFPHPIEGATGFVGEFVLLSVEAGFPLDLKQGSDRIKADTSFPVHGATVTPPNTKKPPLPTSIWPNGKAYFFRGAEYVSYDARADTADAGYPQPILGHWLGFPEEFSGGIDTEVLWNNGKAYFFKGTQYLRYDVATSRVDEGYPQSIRVNWRGMWDSDIDAAVVWPNGKAYFFRGPQYIRYDITSDKADEGYPQDIKANWRFPASFMDGIDGAVMWNNGKAYFFKGDQYIRYDVATDKTDEGPMPIAGHWPGLWEK